MRETSEQSRIERFVTGPLEVNTYVVSKTGTSCVVIDPSAGCEDVLACIRENNWTVEAILLTHGHFDHILGIGEIRKAFPEIDVWVHPDEKPLLSNPEYNGSTLIGMSFTFTGATRDLVEGEMTIAGITFTVAHVPGHSPGGCALITGNACFSGDALFPGSIGRTDFTGGDMNVLLGNIRSKLLTLPDETVVYPGHMNRTTIGREKRLNQFLV